ncbi:MAG TPA: hypothetical protein PK231_04755 [Acidocella sp.]|nr:hypothetical protein [Acidocella sp.]
MTGQPDKRGLKRLVPSEALVRSFFKKDAVLSEKTINNLIDAIQYYNFDSLAYTQQFDGYLKAKATIRKMQTMAKNLKFLACKAVDIVVDDIDEELSDIDVRGIFAKDFRKNLMLAHGSIVALQKSLAELKISVHEQPIFWPTVVMAVLPFIETALHEAGIADKPGPKSPKAIALMKFLSAVGWNIKGPALVAALNKIPKDEEA